MKKLNLFKTLGLTHLSLFCLFFILTGCANQTAVQQIKTFSDATVLTSSNATQIFQLVEEKHHDSEIAEEILNFTTNGLDEELLKPYFLETNLQIRLNVLAGLKEYAANLSTLTGNSPITNLNQDTTSLASSLTNIDGDLVKKSFFGGVNPSDLPTSQEIDLFATGINALGNWVISHQQAKEAKSAIIAMKPNIDQVCNLFQADLKILQDRLRDDDNLIYHDDDRYIREHFDYYINHPEDLKSAVNGEATLFQAIKKDQILVSGLSSSFSKLAATHDALDQAFSTNTENVVSLVAEFSSQAQRINQYYNSLGGQSSK